MASYQNRTPISAIVDYWAPKIDECDLSIDWSEAEEYCWNCGSPKDLTRCHIIPHSCGGKDTPSNYVLLCRKCHEEAPNVADPRIMWDWLIAHSVSFYKTYWIVEGYREYEFMYRRSVDDELSYIRQKASCDPELTDLNERVKEALDKTTTHFGQYTPNKATIAGALRIALLQYANDLGVTLPNGRDRVLTPPEYLT